jgi:hypothetical protein
MLESGTINLWRNNLRVVPDEIWEQTDERILILADNGLTEVSLKVGKLQNVQTLAFSATLSTGHFIVSARGLSTAAPHDLAERLKVSLRFAVSKKSRDLQSRQLFCDGCGYELIDARAILCTLLFHRLLEGTR